jgi:hypothetical protein
VSYLADEPGSGIASGGTCCYLLTGLSLSCLSLIIFTVSPTRSSSNVSIVDNIDVSLISSRNESSLFSSETDIGSSSISDYVPSCSISAASTTTSLFSVSSCTISSISYEC